MPEALQIAIGLGMLFAICYGIACMMFPHQFDDTTDDDDDCDMLPKCAEEMVPGLTYEVIDGAGQKCFATMIRDAIHVLKHDPYYHKAVRPSIFDLHEYQIVAIYEEEGE